MDVVLTKQFFTWVPLREPLPTIFSMLHPLDEIISLICKFGRTECCFKFLWTKRNPHRIYPVVAPSQHPSEASAKEILPWPDLSRITPSTVRVAPPPHPVCREFYLWHGSSKSCSFPCVWSAHFLRVQMFEFSRHNQALRNHSIFNSEDSK